MKFRSSLLIVGAAALLGPWLLDQTAARERVNLDGTWQFATDPGDRGEAERWYRAEVSLPRMPLPGYAATADGRITVPGAWDNQGYGGETDKVRHNFVGKGWYKRQVTIPTAWTGRRIFLVVTGVHRASKTWINDRYLGEHVGYMSSQEFDITPHVALGSAATITIQVDSKQRWDRDALYGGSSMADYMEVAWGGIWGHVFLEARENVWLDAPYIRTNIADSSCSMSALLRGEASGVDSVALEVFDQSGQRVAKLTKPHKPQTAGRPEVALTASLPDARLWTPETPTLYTARLSVLKNGRIIDSIEQRFGIREFSVEGTHLKLNGRRLMLRGYGDDHIYADRSPMPSDKQLHLERLKMIKSYGFNHVRHHSTMMPPEYYDACDEIGMIATAEFPICYDDFLPGIGAIWKANVPKGTDPAAAIENYKQQWAAAITRYRNHPSILCWVMGNELWEGVPLRQEFHAIAQQLDPSRVFLDSDGVRVKRINAGMDRDSLGFYSIQFYEKANPIDMPAKFFTKGLKKPAISHEAGNYVTFSRPDLIDCLSHNIKPFWLTAGKAKLEKLGLLAEADQWAEKSERQYAILHKMNLESLRKNGDLSGYHWWLFQDYWTSSNGIVDHCFRPKAGIRRQEVLDFNNDVVLLQDGLAETYRDNQHLHLRLLVSNYSLQPVQGTLRWEVVADGRSVAQSQKPFERLPQGTVSEVGQIDANFPAVTKPTRLKIAVTAAAGGRTFSNHWTSWLFPKLIEPETTAVPILGEPEIIPRLPPWIIKPYPAENALSEKAVYVTSKLTDQRLVDALERGASVVLLGSADGILKRRPVTFKTTWWKAGESYDENHCGTFVYDHPATRAMAPDGWCDAGWFTLVDGAVKYVLEGAPARPEVIVRALPSLVLVEDDAMVFAVGVGKGRLIVSGLNHGRAQDRPENEWILARLFDYAVRGEVPKAVWPASQLRQAR